MFGERFWGRRWRTKMRRKVWRLEDEVERLLYFYRLHMHHELHHIASLEEFMKLEDLKESLDVWRSLPRRYPEMLEDKPVLGAAPVSEEEE